MSAAHRFTVEQIELQANEHENHANYAEQFGALGNAAENKRDAAMLRAFALQTRQVEQMREWLDKLEGKHTPQCVASRRLFTRVQREFTTLFPKDGGQ